MASRNWKRSFSQIALRKQPRKKSIHSNTSTSETVLLEFQRFQSILVHRRYVRHFFVHSTECTVSVKYRLVSCLFHVSTSLLNRFTALSNTTPHTKINYKTIRTSSLWLLFYGSVLSFITIVDRRRCTTHNLQEIFETKISDCNEKSTSRRWMFWRSSPGVRAMRVKLIMNVLTGRLRKHLWFAKMKNSIRLVVGRGRRLRVFNAFPPFPCKTVSARARARAHSTENWLSTTKSALRAKCAVVQRWWQYRKLGENSLFFSLLHSYNSRKIVQIAHSRTHKPVMDGLVCLYGEWVPIHEHKLHIARHRRGVWWTGTPSAMHRRNATINVEK